MSNTTLDWIKTNIHPDGGVRAWPGADAYPEVTGYLIPTLKRWGEESLASTFADYLVAIQNKDGSFPGLDGVSRTFDTAACYEGLCAAERHVERILARKWLLKHSRGRAFYIDINKTSTHVYTRRVNGILHVDITPVERLFPYRSHYIAYALEGHWLLKHYDYVREKLDWLSKYHIHDGISAYYINDNTDGFGTDLCATAQIGILGIQAGMGDFGTLDALEHYRRHDGGIAVSVNDGLAVSWAAKYYLDLACLVYKEKRNGGA